MKNKKSLAAIMAATVIFAAMAGCARGTETEGSASPTPIVTSGAETEIFSDRDMEVGYDEAASVRITLSDDSSSVVGSGVKISGNTVTISDEGTYLISGSLSDGQVLVDAGETDKLQIVLDNAEISNSSSAAIYVVQADKVFITTAKDSQNTMKVGGEFVATDDNNIDATIFSKADLTLNGTGSLNLETAYGNGVTSKDNLVLTSGTYKIDVSGHGIEGKESASIANGSYTIAAGKKGIKSDLKVTINGGEIDITESGEGIEGRSIDLLGGTLNVVATDDGLNAASSDSTASDMPGQGGMAVDESIYINISGGIVQVDAGGDGMDSNGGITISGGETYISGTAGSGDSALDYDGAATITGGIFIGAGSAQMAQNFGAESTQAAYMTSFTSAQTGKISLTDESGALLAEFTPTKQFQSVVISAGGMELGGTYTLTAGQETQAVTLDSLITGSGGGMGGGGGHMGGGKGGEMGGEPPQRFEGTPPEGVPSQ